MGSLTSFAATLNAAGACWSAWDAGGSDVEFSQSAGVRLAPRKVTVTDLFNFNVETYSFLQFLPLRMLYPAVLSAQPYCHNLV